MITFQENFSITNKQVDFNIKREIILNKVKAEMIFWVSDCWWDDIEPKYIPDLSYQELKISIIRHYEGGFDQFLRDSMQLIKL